MSQPGAIAEEDPVTALASRLRSLRIRAGNPSISQLAELTSQRGEKWKMPRSTIQDKLHGTTAPHLEHVLGLVRACADHAASSGSPLLAAEVDEDMWREAWYAMQHARLDPRRRLYGAARAATTLAAADSTSRRPQEDSQPTPSGQEMIKQVNGFIKDLANFDTSPESVYYIGQTLTACEAFLDDQGITDSHARALINELSDELDNDARHTEGLFSAVISTRKVRGLIQRLREIRRSFGGLLAGERTILPKNL